MSVTLSTLQHTTEKRAREDSEALEILDESALAKKARKDARVSLTQDSASMSDHIGHAQS
jgi:hypothetical protein